MKKIRCYLVIIALLATLGGSALQGVRPGLLANATSSLHARASFMVGKLMGSEDPSFERAGVCPGGGADDC